VRRLWKLLALRSLGSIAEVVVVLQGHRSVRRRDPSPRQPAQHASTAGPMPRQSLTDAPASSASATEPGNAATAARTIRTIVLEQGFEGVRLNTDTMSDLPTLIATILTKFAPVTNSAMRGPLYKLKHLYDARVLCFTISNPTIHMRSVGDQYAPIELVVTCTRRRSAYCTTSGWDGSAQSWLCRNIQS
jgi:hypothetical protein